MIAASLHSRGRLLLCLSIIGYENLTAIDEHDRMWIRSLCSTDPIRYANAVSMSVTIWDLRMLSTFLASNFAEKEAVCGFDEGGFELRISQTNGENLTCAAIVTGLDGQHFEFFEMAVAEELAEFKRQLDLVIVALARSALRQ
jgi:hypothetical protein